MNNEEEPQYIYTQEYLDMVLCLFEGCLAPDLLLDTQVSNVDYVIRKLRKDPGYFIRINKMKRDGMVK